MAKIKVTNPKQIINGGAKKYYFKVKGVGGIKGDKGDKGDTGSQGPQGPQGNAATIMVGSTTTLPTGYDATVTNTGTINNAILNFGIPRGIKGDTGAKGDKGDKGDKGEQGNTGPQGPAGQNATVYVGTTTTGAAGTQASVYNSGTDRNAVLNFTIPQGAKGDTGATGATGPQGPAGQDGQNFTPTIVETLPTTGDQSKLYLTPKNYTTGTATGNPITISLGEDAGQITSAQLDGDTYQQSYTGKNLFDKDKALDNYFYTSTGSKQTYSKAQFCNNEFVPTGDKITMSFSAAHDRQSGSNIEANVRIVQYDASGNFISRLISRTNGHTFTLDTNTKSFILCVDNGSDAWFDDLQVEYGTTATTYEPYVGGVPSPNPDYPQQVQTVTGEQTVTVVGKNLFDIDSIITGYELISATGEVRANAEWWVTPLIPVKAREAYTSSNMRVLNKVFYNENGDFVSTITTQTATAPTGASYVRMNAKLTDLSNYTGKAQLELGSTASSYTPYNKQTLPISLGSIELCKLGTYQDYIWKDGDDWKVHKAIKKVALSDVTNWAEYTQSSIVVRYFEDLQAAGGSSGSNPIVTNGFHSKFLIEENSCFLGSNNHRVCFCPLVTLNWTNYISDNHPVVYYALATPTDTTITDTNLIAQLEAVRNATLQASNTITNTATGSNLAGDLELGYCEYDPQNRYDKWLWLDLNNNYEKLGS